MIGTLINHSRLVLHRQENDALTRLARLTSYTTTAGQFTAMKRDPATCADDEKGRVKGATTFTQLCWWYTRLLCCLQRTLKGTVQ